MSDLIPVYNITEFKRLKPEQIKRLKSAEITFDGEYLFTFINPTTDFIKVQAEYQGQLSNSVGKEDLKKILAEE